MATKTANNIPPRCFSVDNGKLIVITAGESGYVPVPCVTDPQTAADSLNESESVTKAQHDAMRVGSMFGWGVPGADPANQ